MDTFWGSEALGRGGDEANAFGIPARGEDIISGDKDKGQYGLAFMSVIGEVEYGAFYSRYHETLPMLALDPDEDYSCDIFGDGSFPNCSSVFGLSQTWAEDQDMIGLSMATTVGDWSVAAEASYRPDQAIWGDIIVKQYVNPDLTGPDANTNIERHDTVHASVNGIWLGGAIDWLGMDAQVALVQVGVDTLSGDTSNLALNSYNTRSTGVLTGTSKPDNESYGAAVEWIGTWNMGSTAINLDIFVSNDFSGTGHYFGNFAEGRTSFAGTVSATIASDFEASISYAGMTFADSDYEDQDTLALSANYKF